MTYDIDARRVGITDPDSMDLAEAKLRDVMGELETLRFRSQRLYEGCRVAANIFLELKNAHVGIEQRRWTELMGTAESLIRDAMEGP
jgi:hypothetical protein